MNQNKPLGDDKAFTFGGARLPHVEIDPDSPFGFDELVNEYYVKHKFRGRDSQMVVCHHPWCGGVASGSHRASHFHDLDPTCCSQIADSTNGCQTINDVIVILGKPDNDEFTTVKNYEQKTALLARPVFAGLHFTTCLTK